MYEDCAEKSDSDYSATLYTMVDQRKSGRLVIVRIAKLTFVQLTFARRAYIYRI